jgi:transcriptional regulator with XRE-family HTH domain
MLNICQDFNLFELGLRVKVDRGKENVNPARRVHVLFNLLNLNNYRLIPFSVASWNFQAEGIISMVELDKMFGPKYSEFQYPELFETKNMDDVGDKLRTLRKSRGMSLKQLAAKVGCSASYLSMIENQKLNPSVSRLKSIAEGLGTTIIELFQEPRRQEMVLREHERPRVAFPGSRLKIEILVPQNPKKAMDARLAILEPGGGSVGDYRHSGEEFGLVLEGTMELTIDGIHYQLTAGDSFYFPSTKDHRFRNTGSKNAVVVWVNHPPSW